ncbi:hypothetical protein BH24CHL5_BH24CHL5_04590 [soil metagenome]
MMGSLSPLTRLVGAIAVVAVVVAAIALSLPASGPGRTTKVTPLPVGTLVALASAQPAPTNPIEASPSPTFSATPDGAVAQTPAVDEALAASDGFWNRWVDPPRLFQFEAESLADVTRQADLIIRGRVTDLYIGEYWRGRPEEKPSPVVYVRVQISDVLQGEPVSRTPGYVEIQLGSPAGPEEVEDYRARVPAEDSLWFLMYGPNFKERTLEPQRSSELAKFVYIRFNHYQGMLRDIDGLIRVVRPDFVALYGGDKFFPLPLDGTDFEEVVDQVRDLVRSTPEASATAP